MNAIFEIENSKIKNVIKYELPIINYEEDNYIEVDISSLTIDEKNALKLAISNDKENSYTDIEMFFVSGDDYPNFGPDYKFSINENRLIGNYTRIDNKKL